MLITETASSTTPHSVDEDDEISFLYSNPPPPNNKGKSILIDPPVDDDEIQFLFSTSFNRRKKRKSFINNDDSVLIFGSSSKGNQEIENNQLNPKKQEIIDLDSFLDYDEEVEKGNLVKNFGVVDDLSLLMCDICAEEKPKIGFLTVMGCDHSYCFECIGRYVASKLQENVVEISCPVLECEGVLGPEYCRSILPVEVYDRWGLALCEGIITPSQKFYCPYKECSALMIDDSEETGEVIRRMECPNCERMFCVKCKVAWHEGVECEEFQTLNEGERGPEDVMLVDLAKKNMWKRCPRCKMYVQRSQGCNSMLCRCGCGFCYACGSSFENCQCKINIPHHLPGGGALRAMNLARQMQGIAPHFNPPLDNATVNQTPTIPPTQLRQGQVGVPLQAALQARLIQQRQQLRNMSPNQTQPNPSIQPLQQGPTHYAILQAQLNRLVTLNNRLINQTQLLQQGPVGGGPNTSQVRQQLEQNRAANQTQTNPSIQLLQQGPVGGGPDTSLVGQQLEQNRSVNQTRSNPSTQLLQQGPVGGDPGTSQARQQLLQRRLRSISASQTFRAMLQLEQNRSANQTQSNPSSIQPVQQGPVGGRLNTSLVRQQLEQNRSANQTQSNASIQPLQQGPVGGRLNTSLVRQQLEQNRSANQTQSNPSIQLLQQGPVRGGPDNSQARQQLEQNRSANQTQSNPSIELLQQGPVGGGPDNSQARQQQLEQVRLRMRSATQVSQARHLARMQFEMMNRFPNLPANQTPSNATIRPVGSSVARTNEFIPASPSLTRTSHVDPMENLPQESSASNHARRGRQV